MLVLFLMTGPKEKEEPRQVDVSGPVPALETAVTTERAELLEIGMNTYRQVLEELVRDRSDRSVAVLRATGAMVRGFMSAHKTRHPKAS